MGNSSASWSGCRRPNPGTVRCSDASLRQVFVWAYGVRPVQVEVPAWIGRDGYDVEAKVPMGASPGQVTAMIQRLVAERFHLVRKEERPYPGYTMTAANGDLILTEVNPAEVATFHRGDVPPPLTSESRGQSSSTNSKSVVTPLRVGRRPLGNRCNG